MNNPVKFIDPTGMKITDYRNEQGELLYKTDDGLKDIIIVKDGDIPNLEKELNEAYVEGKIDDPTTNQENMHALGRSPEEYSKEKTNGLDDYWVHGYKETYEEAHKEGKSQFSLGQIISSFVAAIAADNEDNSGEMRHAQDGRYFRRKF